MLWRLSIRDWADGVVVARTANHPFQEPWMDIHENARTTRYSRM